MQKSIKYLLAAVAITPAFFLFKNDVKTSEVKGVDPDTNPGYFEQYFQMKKNEQNVIPANAWRTWVDFDRLSKKSENVFDNVREIGPTNIGGRTRSIVIDHEDNDRLYAGGVSGGFWTSLNKGVSWSQADDYLPTLSLTSITQSPFDVNQIYYSTGERYGNSAGIPGSGIFKSTDRGESFEMLPESDTNAFNYTWRIEHSLVYDSTVYVGTDGDGVWVTRDAGQSFQKIYATASAIRDIEVFEDSTLWFSIQGRGIFKMDERTNDVVKLEGGLPTSDVGNIDIDYCESQPEVAYAVITKSSMAEINGIFKTVDGGDTWTETAAVRSNFRWSQGRYDLFIEVDYDDPDFVVTGAVDAVYSVNGAASWTNLALGHVDYHCATFFPNSQEYLIGNDGGIYSYNQTSSGTAYSNLNRGYNVTQFYAGYYFPNDDHTLGGTQDNGTYLNRNESGIGLLQLWGDGAYCAVDQQNETVYASWQNLNLRRKTSVDVGGWVNISNGVFSLINSSFDLWFINPFEINSVDGQQIYVVTKNNIIRSINAGTSWEKATDRILGNAYCVALTKEDDPLMYVGGQSGVLYRQENAKTIEEEEMLALYTTSPQDFKGSFIGNIEINPQNPNTIYTALTNFSIRPRIWRVRNTNSNNPVWEDISANLPENLPVNWIEVDPNDSNLIMIATDNGLYTSANGGGWWVKDETIPNVTIPQIRLRESDRRLYIYTHGRGIWIADLKDNKDITSTRDLAEISVNVYPNPTSERITVDGDDIEGISVFDLSGKEVVSFTEGNRVNVAALRPGTYFVSVLTEQGEVVKQIQKI